MFLIHLCSKEDLANEHRCIKNIKKIYQHEVKCDDQQNLKDIIDAAILSTP